MSNPSDLAIQKDVMAELEYEPRLDAANIGVAVHGGAVTLSGHVASLGEKAAAEAAARRVRGVRSVVEHLEVRLAGELAADEDIAARAADVLSWTAFPRSNPVKISVSDGWVTLSGQVDWDHERQEAERAVRRLVGVRGLVNQLSVRPRLRPDNVHELIAHAFERNAQLEGAQVQVAVEGSKVILSGRVKTWHEQDMAERAALSAPGVTQVVNEIQIG
jgi:osmotically-inducible protein OsmY